MAEGKQFVKLHLYKNQNSLKSNKENALLSDDGFEDKSPSKMTD